MSVRCWNAQRETIATSRSFSKPSFLSQGFREWWKGDLTTFDFSKLPSPSKSNLFISFDLIFHFSTFSFFYSSVISSHSVKLSEKNNSLSFFYSHVISSHSIKLSEKIILKPCCGLPCSQPEGNDALARFGKKTDAHQKKVCTDEKENMHTKTKGLHTSTHDTCHSQVPQLTRSRGWENFVQKQYA